MNKKKVRSTYNCRNRIIYGTQDFAINKHDTMSIEEINVALESIKFKVSQDRKLNKLGCLFVMFAQSRKINNVLVRSIVVLVEIGTGGSARSQVYTLRFIKLLERDYTIVPDRLFPEALQGSRPPQTNFLSDPLNDFLSTASENPSKPGSGSNKISIHSIISSLYHLIFLFNSSVQGAKKKHILSNNSCSNGGTISPFYFLYWLGRVSQFYQLMGQFAILGSTLEVFPAYYCGFP